MTRINAKIRPAHLCDQHLMAEYREIVRIPNAVRSNPDRVRKVDQPIQFRLGTGHVVFFYDKLKFLHDRFNELRNELITRNVAVTMTDDMFHNLPDDLYNDWNPTDFDYKFSNRIVCDRICDRVDDMKVIKMNGAVMDKNKYIGIFKAIYQ